jgi:hypothetical protein
MTENIVKNKDYWECLTKEQKALWKNREAFWNDLASIFLLIGDQNAACNG